MQSGSKSVTSAPFPPRGGRPAFARKEFRMSFVPWSTTKGHDKYPSNKLWTHYRHTATGFSRLPSNPFPLHSTTQAPPRPLSTTPRTSPPPANRHGLVGLCLQTEGHQTYTRHLARAFLSRGLTTSGNPMPAKKKGNTEGTPGRHEKPYRRKSTSAFETGSTTASAPRSSSPSAPASGDTRPGEEQRRERGRP